MAIATTRISSKIQCIYCSLSAFGFSASTLVHRPEEISWKIRPSSRVHPQPPATTSVQNLLYGYAFVFSGPRYGFGWENQLLETAFLAAFAVPLLSLRPFAPACPTPAVIPWLYKWLAFRVMFGAGLIKIRGDKAWKDLTAMDYHYETQPLPNPISYFLHQAPKKFHR